MFVESNYSGILARAAQPAKDAAKIILNKYVVGVKTPEARGSGQKVEISTSDGETMTFDEVVMTTPLGWLKHNMSCFSPSLTDPVRGAIEHLSLSQLEKVFITFPKVFWTDDPVDDTFPCYTNWLTPEYAQDTNPSGWPQEIWDLSTFKAPNNHPTILFYLYGDCSRHIVNSIYGKTKDEKFNFLDSFFRPYYSRLPKYDAADPDCQPKAILATEWLKDELNGYGSYCNFQVGVEAADQDVLAIKEGCPERRLWFCGEHAAPFEECGTVAGAYLSGESAANKIIEIYQKQDRQ
jgi:hypothetical protein